MSPFRTLVVAVVLFLGLGAFAAFLVGVPWWAVLVLTLVALLIMVLVLGRAAQRSQRREKANT